MQRVRKLYGSIMIDELPFVSWKTLLLRHIINDSSLLRILETYALDLVTYSLC